jgi:hypothetical protein
VVTTGEYFVTKLLISGKSTSDKTDELFSTFDLILRDAKLDSQAKIIEMLREAKSDKESAVQGSGHAIANARIRSRYSVIGYINEKMSVRNNVILSEIFSNNVKRIRKYDIDNLYGMEPLMCFFYYITHLLYIKLLPGSYVKDLYKLSNAEMTQLEGFDSMYSEEIVKRYIYKKYGQEKIDKKREMMDKKSENMKKLRKDESERKERLIQERKAIIYDILARHGLHYMWSMTEAERFISEGSILNEEELLKESKKIIDKTREEQKRKENLKENLMKYNCMDKKTHYLCKDYIKNGASNHSLEYVVDYIRDLMWLERYTNYYIIIHNRNQIYIWDEVLGRYIYLREYNKIFNDYNDLTKTYAVELWMEKKNIRMDENWKLDLDESNIPPPMILKRMEEVVDKIGVNKEKERAMQEERKLKIEANKAKKKIKYT